MTWFKNQPKAILLLRIVVSAIFLAYGSVKLSGGQYYYGDWTMDKETANGPSLVWAFYGYSPIYGRITGLFEFIPAIMLLFRRTSLVGAAALFAVSLNITLMDFAFGFPSVKYFILGCTVACTVLILHEKDKLTALFAGAPREREGQVSN
ncbi:hypothetical protein [Amycolatopsis marina]|uniref:hypothetical protein n=1 Tax=Amycolatopsis marina TaxID=490629 RepID=UPI001160CF97|nr:hypothetical protein [Amycolatopsis marina]